MKKILLNFVQCFQLQFRFFSDLILELDFFKINNKVYWYLKTMLTSFFFPTNSEWNSKFWIIVDRADPADQEKITVKYRL